MGRGEIESFGDRRGKAKPPTGEEPDPGDAVLRMQPLPVLVVPAVDTEALEAARKTIHDSLYDAARSALEAAVADFTASQEQAAPS